MRLEVAIANRADSFHEPVLEEGVRAEQGVEESGLTHPIGELRNRLETQLIVFFIFCKEDMHGKVLPAQVLRTLVKLPTSDLEHLRRICGESRAFVEHAHLPPLWEK